MIDKLTNHVTIDQLKPGDWCDLLGAKMVATDAYITWHRSYSKYGIVRARRMLKCAGPIIDGPDAQWITCDMHVLPIENPFDGREDLIDAVKMTIEVWDTQSMDYDPEAHLACLRESLRKSGHGKWLDELDAEQTRFRAMVEKSPGMSIAEEKEKKYLHCLTCGKQVSTGYTEDIIVRASIQCPECAERSHDAEESSG